MDFPKLSKIKPVKSADEHTLNRLLPHNCCLYIIPPLVDITLKDFEELAIERLKLLRILESAGLKHPKLYSDEWKDYVINELNMEGLKHFVRLLKGNDNKEQDMNARRRDYLSHFILRFAYCRSEELRRWFIAREMEFFRFKFSALTAKDIKEFLEVYEMNYTPITAEQKDEVLDGLSSYDTTKDFYKVSFLEVFDLVRSRRVFLKSGFAYVSTTDFGSIVGNKHQKFIEKGLHSHLSLLPEIMEDDRLFSIIKGLHTSYIGKDYTISKEADVPIASLDQLSLKSFPLCMRNTHEVMRAKHHLKYGGRLQYGLFLKGIGVTLDDSLQFWREEFTKIMDPDKFDKTYAYGVRYNYGKEGSRTNWSPFSCMKIINSAIGAADVCGCPFKLWDASELRTKLNSYGVNPVSTQEIVSFATKGHFQIACGRYFEVTHNAKMDEGVTHPNGFFENSQIVMGGRQAKTKTSSQTPQQSQYNQRKQSQMTQQQAVKRKLENRNREINTHEYDEELWKLSQREEELLTQLKAKEIKVEQMKMEISQVATMEWGDDEEDDEMSQMEIASELTEDI